MSNITHAILVIDDEPEIIKALERTLSPIAPIYSATSGKEGLALTKNKNISVVICDQRMPEMTGIEFFKELFQRNPYIVRIILTAYTDIEDLIEAINEIGLYRYITKPWDNHELKLTARRAMERFDLEQRNRELVQELRKANVELEKKVEDRTKALHETNKKLENLSLTDELTLIGNHRYFKQVLSSEIERAYRYQRPLSLLLIDVDDFKKYNDRFGHIVGDRVLKKIAQILKENTRNTDTLARYGGEEFAIILPETEKERARILSERIRHAVASKKFPFKLPHTKGLTISIGLSCHDKKPKANAKKIIQEADKALYKAKIKGRNRIEG